LEAEIEAMTGLWEQRAIEEIVDLMRGVLQPQDGDRLRVLSDERNNGSNREPQPDMSAFEPL
jgi:hypothetical protein